MINVYDILVNPKKIAYDFYEWDKEDRIKHIKKIVGFKVDSKTMIDFINSDIIVDPQFLNEIENKTEIFIDREIKKIKYACILFCDLECIYLSFDNKGNTVKRSKLLFDEADDIVRLGKKQKEIHIKYSIKSNIVKTKNYTRKEIKDINKLLNYINYLHKKEKSDVLKYLYYECFKKENASEKMLIDFKNVISCGDLNVINKLNFLLALIKS